MARIDNVIVAVRSAEQYTNFLHSHYGLASYQGGRLAGIGIESHIVPLTEGFLDIVSVVDEREAASNPLGRAVLSAIEEVEVKLLSWAVDPGNSIQAAADRLGLAVNPLKRALPDGGHTAWKTVGLQQAVEDGPLPFFIEWPSKKEQPDQVLVEHEGDPMGFAWVEVKGKRERLEEWLGESLVPLQYVEGEGPDGVEAVGIMTDTEVIVLRDAMDVEGPGVSAVEEEAVVPNTSKSSQNGEEKVSTFAAVLDSIEQAIESAAVAVETMAGGVTTPRELGRDSDAHSE